MKWGVPRPVPEGPWEALQSCIYGSEQDQIFTLRNHSKGDISKFSSLPFLSPEFLTLLKAHM